MKRSLYMLNPRKQNANSVASRVRGKHLVKTTGLLAALMKRADVQAQKEQA